MQSNTNLTRKQQEVLDYLIANQDQFIQPPILDELCFEMGLKSRGSLHKHIQGLINAGLVQAPNRKQQGIRLTEQALEIKTTVETTSPINEEYCWNDCSRFSYMRRVLTILRVRCGGCYSVFLNALP